MRRCCLLRTGGWRGRRSGWGRLPRSKWCGGWPQVSITARILGPEGFGALAVIVAVSALIHGLVALPGGDTVTTFVTRSVTEGRREEAGAILRLTLVVSQGLSLAAYAVIVALALTASSLLGISESHVNALLLYGLLGVFLATRSETLAVLRLADRVNLGLAVTVAATLTSLGLIVLAWRTDGGLPAVVTAYAAAAAVNGSRDVRSSSGVRSKGGGRWFSDFAVAEGPFGCGKVPIRLRSQERRWGHWSRIWTSVLMAQFAYGGRPRHLQGRAPDHRHDQTPFQLIRFGVQPEYSRQWYSGQGAGAAAFVAPIHHCVAHVGRRWLCAARHTSQTYYSARARGRFCGGLLALADHDSGGFVAGAAAYSILPVATGRTWPILASGREPSWRRFSSWCGWYLNSGRGRRMGQNDLLNGLCPNSSALHSIHLRQSHRTRRG